MPVKIAIVTVSDSSFNRIREDQSGPAIKKAVESSSRDLLVTGIHIVPDDIIEIQEKLRQLLDNDVIITTGGTGFAPRDVTPEATIGVIEKRCNGLETALHVRSLQATPMAALSRSVAGIIGSTLIVNFPGSPKAVKECWEVLEPILEHGVHLIKDLPTTH